MLKLRNETILNSPGSPTNKISSIVPTTIRDDLAPPIDLKKINLNDMKKQIVKMNPDKSELGIFHEFILQKDEPINQELAAAYD